MLPQYVGLILIRPMCGWDSELELVVHRFEPGKYRCRCGLRVVRQPVLEQSFWDRSPRARAAPGS